jgi:hypothetical protein
MAKTWQIILATLGIFIAGIVAGGATALGVVRWVTHHPHALPPGLALFNPRPGMQQSYGPQLMRSFSDKLDLTDSQRLQVEPIISRTAAQLGHARRTTQIESILAIEKMQDEISGLLTADQKSRFEELVSEQRARLQRRLKQLQQEPERK